MLRIRHRAWFMQMQLLVVSIFACADGPKARHDPRLCFVLFTRHPLEDQTHPPLWQAGKDRVMTRGIAY